ncbi:HD-GYP domain-containing protein [Paenibacillus protaetiae]|uniref:HD-GYP domain-containing protein n=1 Tax=Paenibacillus protaetiae TaxID=2509456 RepID=A0A4P6EXT4_9BACL|nr:HD-GYP domain-containing protein [Paenibacillus protaetiae]QAY67485.1 HD-GYP domain-containing protein [Paenibacillus protaetiae]
MSVVAVSQLKLGDKLAGDVLTPLGSTLFHKGKVIQGREIEILKAFMVQQVSISDDRNRTMPPNQDGSDEIQEQNAGLIKAPAAPIPFDDEYERLVELLKKTFKSAAAGEIPVLELRQQLEKVLRHIGSYNPLTFAPRSFKQPEYMYHSSAACALTSYLIAQWVGLPQKDWMQIAMAGLFHDIGNSRIDPDILFKPSGLTPDEQEKMRRHTTVGYQLLKNVAALNEGVKLAALQHHEREDGTGYPLNLTSEGIHTYAKIIAIADIFHAMAMNKPYRQGQSPYLVLEQIKSDAFGKLDPAYVTVFVDRVTQFHNGTLVRLSDGRTGEIVFSDRVYPTRPWVSINGTIVNLTVERQLYIKEVIK